ncbi:MAG: IMP dehydrogenase [Bdellovibrionales bacterium]
MSLIFSWKDLKNRSKAYTYNDVLIIPSKSDMRSRKDPDLSSRLTKKSLWIFLCRANMDTITEAPMALAMAQEGGIGILHGFYPLKIKCLRPES